MGENGNGNGKGPRLENRITLGSMIGAGTVLVAVAVAWGVLQGDVKALGVRIDRGETRDDDTAKTLSDLKGGVIELRTDQKAIRTETERQSRQLDRIEQLVRSGQPPRTP